MYRLSCLFGAFLAQLSLKTIGRIARVIAVLVFDIFCVRRALVLKNLKIAFGDEKSEEELIKIGRESVYNFTLTSLEFFRSYKTDIAEDISFQGMENVRKALDKGKGVYVLCMHQGNFEAMGAACTRCIRPTYTVVKRVGSESMNRFVEERRHENGFYTIARKERGDAFKAIRTILERGDMVGIAFDQARPGEPRIPFFGTPAKTNTSIAAIKMRIPAPILPGFARRISPGKHEIIFLPEIETPKTDDRSADILHHTELFNQAVEKCIRTCPEQYFWMHDRWK